MQKPRDIFLDACAQLGDALAPRGFKYVKSGPHVERDSGDFTFRVWFQSSRRNIPGEYVALWLHASVLSKRLSRWLAAQPHALRNNDGVAGSHIGGLEPQSRWLDLNLADPKSRDSTLALALATIESNALPYFSQFEDVPTLCRQLITQDLPGMSILSAVEFLLCFADQSVAENCFHRFLCQRADLVPLYFSELDRIRHEGIPSVRSTGYAVELAYATIAYGLTPPNGRT